MMTAPIPLAGSAPPLQLARAPGRLGLTLRCAGELNVATVEALRRELALLRHLRPPLLTLDLTRCTALDIEGILAILDAFEHQREDGHHLLVVTGTGPAAHLCDLMSIGRLLPTVPTAELAGQSSPAGGSPEVSCFTTPATENGATTAYPERRRQVQ